MKFPKVSGWRKSSAVAFVLVAAVACGWGEEASARAKAGFESYVGSVEMRLGEQRERQRRELGRIVLGSGELTRDAQARLRTGELVMERVPARAVGGGAMLHHWRGTLFVAGARAADFSLLLTDFADYPKFYEPQVLRARMLERQGDEMKAMMRVRQHHVITVVMDMNYDVRLGKLDGQNGYSESRCTEITEIEGAGTKTERRLSGREQHGFMYRLNTYWSYAERDGGLYVQIESVSLTRDIPRGLGWIIEPFIESIPRESLEFTLRRTRDALRKPSMIGAVGEAR